MKKFRFVLLAALLLAFSFMGCKLPETTYTYEFGIVDAANAEKVINSLPNYVNFDILEEAKELWIIIHTKNIMKSLQILKKMM